MEGIPPRILLSGEIFKGEIQDEGEDSTSTSSEEDKENGVFTIVKKFSATVVGLQDLQPAPIGCYINEQIDIAGWVNSEDQTTIPGDLGIGKLDCPLEKFNPEDDCDCRFSNCYLASNN